MISRLFTSFPLKLGCYWIARANFPFIDANEVVEILSLFLAHSATTCGSRAWSFWFLNSLPSMPTTRFANSTVATCHITLFGLLVEETLVTEFGNVMGYPAYREWDRLAFVRCYSSSAEVTYARRMYDRGSKLRALHSHFLFLLSTGQRPDSMGAWSSLLISKPGVYSCPQG